ncbi:unnamed protein product [Cuscuta campestris]|uniref:RRM domain-containing protein n=1 Tax=Cuscuta campestris TaxID=132261 RepID=A0A484LBH0_9ASTE|nr:unnamed protein product [Cuscuta campestris]
MKSRVAASISSLAGGRSINICRTLPVQRTCEALKFRPWSQGIGSSNRSFISFVKEDDSFAELGPAVNENDASGLKLATEKPERFKWQNDFVRKRLSNNNKSHPVNKCGGEKGSILTRGESNQVMNQLLGSFSANRSTDAVKVNDTGALGESSQPMEEHMDDAFITNSSTIRINGVDDRVSIHDIHSLCGKVGNFEGLTWVGKDSVDAFFKVGSESDSTGIVRKLNGYSIAGSHLVASILPNNSKASIPEKEIDWPERGLRFSTTLDELKKQMELKKMYYQDLEMLYHEIMHIQCPPTISDD